MKIDTILIPVDFSDCARAALDAAVGLAEHHDATIDVIHVVPMPAYLPLDRSLFGEDAESHSVEVHIRSSAQADVDAFVKNLSAAAQARVTTHLEIGAPADAIVHAATERKHDLIVIGTHGRRGIARALLGSVAERVVRAAPGPVLTIRGG